MRIRFSFVLLYVWILKIDAMDVPTSDTPTPPPSPRQSISQSNPNSTEHVYCFPAIVTEHLYPITRYPPCERPYAIQRRSLGVPRCPEPDHIGTFVIYTASYQSSWFENPWYCLKKLKEEQSMKEHIEECKITEEQQQLEILMNLLPDKAKKVCADAPLNVKRKLETFEQFLSDDKKVEYDRSCSQKIYKMGYPFLTDDDMAICKKTLHRFIDFLADSNGELKIGPALIYIYDHTNENEITDLPYILKKISQDYSENDNSDFTQHASRLLANWPNHETKQRLQSTWKVIKHKLR